MKESACQYSPSENSGNTNQDSALLPLDKLLQSNNDTISQEKKSYDILLPNGNILKTRSVEKAQIANRYIQSLYGASHALTNKELEALLQPRSDNHLRNLHQETKLSLHRLGYRVKRQIIENGRYKFWLTEKSPTD